MAIDLPPQIPDSASNKVVIEQIVNTISPKALQGKDTFNGEEVNDRTFSEGSLNAIITDKWIAFWKKGPENFIYLDIKNNNGSYGSVDGAAINLKGKDDTDILKIIEKMLGKKYFENIKNENAQKQYEKDVPEYFENK